MKRIPKPARTKTATRVEVTPALVERIWEEYKAGKPATEIAALLAIPKNTVKRLINDGYPRLNIKPLKTRLLELLNTAEQLKAVEDLTAYQEILSITRPLIKISSQRIAKKFRDNPDYTPRFSELTMLLNIHKDTLKAISALKGHPTDITKHEITFSIKEKLKPLQNLQTTEINALTNTTKILELNPPPQIPPKENTQE